MLNFLGGVDVQMSSLLVEKTGPLGVPHVAPWSRPVRGHLGSQDANGDEESTSCILPRIDPRYAHELASSVCFKVFCGYFPWLFEFGESAARRKSLI